MANSGKPNFSSAAPHSSALFMRLSLTVLSALLLAAMSLSANAAELGGTWNGGGTVNFLSGSSEKARCRATYVRKTPVVYGVTATCATPSGRVTQTARLKKIGPNSYSGSFYNADYDTSGTFYVAVRGKAQNVSISATKGSARMYLRRSGGSG